MYDKKFEIEKKKNYKKKLFFKEIFEYLKKF